MNLRRLATRIIMQVCSGRSLTDALAESLTPGSSAEDSAFLKALCYGTCRWYFQLEAILAERLATPLKSKDQDIHALLLLGLFQLLHSHVPPHAAVTETVAAVPRQKPWAKGLVNAILRSCLREPPEQTRYPTHPTWWQEKTQTDWPDNWQAILDANNQHPPLTLRTNRLKQSRDDYLRTLTMAGLAATPVPDADMGIQLEKPVPVSALPGFAAGDVSVQDGAAQLAAVLLAPQSGEVILDACAAPGGKTTHLLEIAPDLARLIALDKSPDRLSQVQENLQRLGLTCTVLAADANDTAAWWDGQRFDRILLDAPCSASGVVRRHPDIRLLRKAGDIPALADQQYRLLDSLWPLLKDGGRLLYATCSVFREENTGVVSRFLAHHTDAHDIVIQADWGRACQIGRQILPGEQDRDGFYYALLEKKRLYKEA